MEYKWVQDRERWEGVHSFDSPSPKFKIGDFVGIRDKDGYCPGKWLILKIKCRAGGTEDGWGPQGPFITYSLIDKETKKRKTCDEWELRLSSYYVITKASSDRHSFLGFFFNDHLELGSVDEKAAIRRFKLEKSLNPRDDFKLVKVEGGRRKTIAHY